MKKRFLRLKVVHEKIQYIRGDIKIKSNIELKEEEIAQILEIVQIANMAIFQDRSYQIARQIVYQVAPIRYAECKFKKKNIILQLRG